MRVLTVSRADGSSVEFRGVEDYKVADSGVLLIEYMNMGSQHMFYVGYAVGQWIGFTFEWVDE